MEVEDARSEAQQLNQWVPLKEALQTYRESVGSPSYGEIAERVAAARVANGMDPYAARVGRTTVYDAFQTNQRRVNLALVREIGWALGASAEEVESWIKRCYKTVETPTEEQTQEDVPNPSWKLVLLVCVGALAINQAGIWITDQASFQLFLDMIGTCLVAVCIGPWTGAVVGYATAFTTYLLGHGYESLWFGIVQVAGALLWGYGVRKGWGRTIPRYFALNLAVACLSTAIAAPLITFLFNGSTRHGTDALYENLMNSGHSLFDSVLEGNLYNSLLDKLLSGLLALVIAAVLPAALRKHFPLATALAKLGTKEKEQS